MNKEAKHKILVKSNTAGGETLSIDNVITVEKDEVQETLTFGRTASIFVGQVVERNKTNASNQTNTPCHLRNRKYSEADAV